MIYSSPDPRLAWNSGSYHYSYGTASSNAPCFTILVTFDLSVPPAHLPFGSRILDLTDLIIPSTSLKLRSNEMGTVYLVTQHDFVHINLNSYRIR